MVTILTYQSIINQSVTEIFTTRTTTTGKPSPQLCVSGLQFPSFVQQQAHYILLYHSPQAILFAYIVLK